MALKNMIKLKDKVTFGHSGKAKKAGVVVKLNQKTAHVKCSNGDVMAVTYNLIQKPSKKSTKQKTTSTARRKPTHKKNPAKKTTPGYAGWLEKRTKTELKKLEKALSVICSGRGTPACSDAKRKHAAVKKEIRKRK